MENIPRPLATQTKSQQNFSYFNIIVKAGFPGFFSNSHDLCTKLFFEYKKYLYMVYEVYIVFFYQPLSLCV